MSEPTLDARQACALPLDAQQAGALPLDARQALRRDRVRRRWWMACAAIGALACAPLVACSDDGKTPDCSLAEAGCGPDLTGTSEGGDLEAAPEKDVEVVDSFVPDTGPGDASSDADAHD